jgi:hypothetical protein
MESANKVPFCLSGYDVLDIRWVVPVPGLTGLTSHRIALATSPELGGDMHLPLLRGSHVLLQIQRDLLDKRDGVVRFVKIVVGPKFLQ